jgi:hypothetical protein
VEDLKYQLVLQLPGETIDEFEQLLQLEDALLEMLEDQPHVVDGHDFGSGTMNLFIDTDDPQAAFALARQIIDPVRYPALKAAFRAFDEDDYTLIWPEGSTEEFQLI